MQVRDIDDPRENIFGGVRLLRILANAFNGDLELTVAAYNAGDDAVMRYGGIPPYDADAQLRGQGDHLLPPLPRDPRHHRSQRRPLRRESNRKIKRSEE